MSIMHLRMTFASGGGRMFDFKCFNVKCYISALVGVIIKVIVSLARNNVAP